MDIEQFKEDLEIKFRLIVRKMYGKIPPKYKHMIFIAVFMSIALMIHPIIQESSSPFEFIAYILILTIIGILLGSTVALLIWLGEYFGIWHVFDVDESKSRLR